MSYDICNNIIITHKSLNTHKTTIFLYTFILIFIKCVIEI